MRRGPLLAAVVLLAAFAMRPLRAALEHVDKSLGFAILEDYEKGESLDGVDRDFALFHELGITTWRGSFAWDHLEPTRGRYDFSWLEQFVDLAAERGITLRPYLAYTPHWAATRRRDKDAWHDPPRNVEDWYRFVLALATAMRRHSNVVSFEIYNEENVPEWWNGTPAAYNNVLRRASDAIRAANPRLQLIFGGMVYPDPRWVRYACTEAGNATTFAILPFHAYPETWPPDVDVEHYLGDHFNDGFVAAADDACGRKPIWINEAGFATVEGRTETDQAEWWARAISTFAAVPRVEEIGVYEIKDLEPDRPAIGGVANYHLGITRVDRTRKTGFGTIQRLVSLFAQQIELSDADLQLTSANADLSTVYRHLFVRHDGHQLLFLWDKAAPATVRVTLPHRGTNAVEYAIDGTPLAFQAFDGTTLSAVQLIPGRVRMFEIVP